MVDLKIAELASVLGKTFVDAVRETPRDMFAPLVAAWHEVTRHASENEYKDSEEHRKVANSQ